MTRHVLRHVLRAARTARLVRSGPASLPTPPPLRARQTAPADGGTVVDWHDLGH